MKKTEAPVHYIRPPWLLTTLSNPVAKTLLRSPWHGLVSRHLLLITFTGHKSGRVFTTPLGYVQMGETVRLRAVASPWWKNLRDGATVHILLRGKMRTGTTEVISEDTKGFARVDVHLK